MNRYLPNEFFGSTSFKTLVTLLAFVGTVALSVAQVPSKLIGGWSLDVEDGTPGWLEVKEEGGMPWVYLRFHVGTGGPYTEEIAVVDGILKFPRKLRKHKSSPASEDIEVGFSKGKLNGVIFRTHKDGSKETIAFSGKKIQPVGRAPDLSQVEFGQPISLFNGKNLLGWRVHEDNKLNGWSVVDGCMVNTTPKTDFGATGDYANLRTDAVFEDFWLHIEFNIGENRNSGVYMRGMYEAQVVDRDSRMQGLQGVGAIFGRIEPSVMEGKKGGEWQSYDLTLVDRHVTVVLNGVKVIDNQPIHGPTGGAVFTDPTQPGPIYLQGDHTAVKYRDVYIAPVIKN